jgi:hypothetical protein
MASARIKQLIIWSPLPMIAVLFLVAFLVGKVIGVWVWVPLVYRKTKALRWVILGHFLVDSFALTVPALMSLYPPSG